MKKSVLGSVLRVIAIVVVSLAAAMTLLGGIGTSCVAFFAEKFGESMGKLIPVKPIFQVLVVVSIAAAVYGIIWTIRLAKGRSGSIRAVLIFLLVGGIASGIQYYYSLTLRGSTAPNNMRLYLTILALAVMLLLQLPGLREKVNFERGTAGGGTASAGGAALLVCGLVILTTPAWAEPTHLINGANTANELFWPLILGGLACILSGVGLLARARNSQIAMQVNEC